MSKKKYIIGEIYHPEIELRIDKSKSQELLKQGCPVGLTFGGGMSNQEDDNSFLARTELVIGQKDSGFFCRIAQWVLVQAENKPSEQDFEAWMNDHNDFLYQHIRQKFISLVSADLLEQDLVPPSLAGLGEPQITPTASEGSE